MHSSICSHLQESSSSYPSFFQNLQWMPEFLVSSFPLQIPTGLRSPKGFGQSRAQFLLLRQSWGTCWAAQEGKHKMWDYRCLHRQVTSKQGFRVVCHILLDKLNTHFDFSLRQRGEMDLSQSKPACQRRLTFAWYKHLRMQFHFSL